MLTYTPLDYVHQWRRWLCASPINALIVQSRLSLKFISCDSYIVNLVLHVMSFDDICTEHLCCRYTVHYKERLQRTLQMSFVCALYTAGVLCTCTVYYVCLVHRCVRIQLKLHVYWVTLSAFTAYTVDVLFKFNVYCRCTVHQCDV